MRPYYLTVLFFFSIPLLTGAGCASIAKYLSFEDSGSGSESDDDPITAAAMRMRRPASSPGLDPDDDALWSHRSTPSADTISYGMAMEDVASIWGRPTHVDAAGTTQDGNQRWVYFSGLSSRYGLGSKRTVYFENGRVVGWKR
jgi:hypothetical protein